MIVQLNRNLVVVDTFQMRRVTLEDLPTVVDLLNACAIDQNGVPDVNENLLESDWTRPSFNLADSVRVAETVDGRIVGYIEVWDIDPLPVSNWVWARVHPDFEGLGIGTQLMQWAEQRLQKTLTRVPDDLQVTYRSGSKSTHGPSKQLLEDIGMNQVRYFWRMVIELDQRPPSPQLPPGIRMSTLEKLGDLRAIYRAFNDSFKDHWGYVEQPEDKMISEWEHWTSTDDEFDPDHWHVAMDSEEIAGVCLCRRREWEDPDMAWVNILGVRRPWRRQGLGLAMLHHAFEKFYHLGKLRVGLGVDANSLTGATGLYEKAGMHVAREFHTYEKVLRSGRDIERKTL
ncbi:MAG: GNAT family N-acetyltransferase [Candidatus Promineifilaceae bacterium]|nr:GNAT family N-acetyltransferase [Candidatus Promineifilaceae bacterium]